MRRTKNCTQRVLQESDEAPPIGADPGTGNTASDQRSRTNLRILDRAQPELNTPQLPTSSAQDQHAAPATTVLTGTQPTTTAAGRIRQRIKWTQQLNKDVMRCYYRQTKCEQEITAYRTGMYNSFIQIHPDFAEKLSEQNLADRRRAILSRKLLTLQEIDVIKEEVKIELELPTEEEVQEVPVPVTNTEETEEQLIQPTAVAQQPVTLIDDLSQLLKANLEQAIIEFKDTDPLHRHKLPKLNSSKRLSRAVDSMNHILFVNT